MFTNRLSHLLLVAIIVVTGCAPQIAPTSAPASVPVTTATPDKPITLQFAVSDGQDTPSAPYVLEFVQQTKILSNGNITIEPIWQAGDDTEAGFEIGVIQLVKKGDMELGLAASRAFDNENINSFQALQAPFLITDDSLAKAVSTSDIATRTLDNLTTAGLAGLTIWPEDLRHPFSLMPDKPLLSPEDFTGLTIRTVPSGISNMLMEAFGGKPIYADSDYQGAEAGLRQGAFLIGKPTATGNVTFFAKYQVLFANGAALEKLSEGQRAVLRQAAAATQTKAITEHPSDVEAGTAWCADGGSIVLASEEQLAAFEKAAQPVFDSIKQDPFNAERIAEISELKAKTEPSSGASACAPGVAQASPEPGTETQVWSAGLPPNGVWQVELTADDFIKMGTLKSTADDMAGLYTWTFQDGQAKIEINGPTISVSCMQVATVDGEAVRLQNVGSADCDGSAYGDVQWRLDKDGLHLHLVEGNLGVAAEIKAMYESKPLQKVEEWSTGLPPNGVWQADLTTDDFVRMGLLRSVAQNEWASLYTLTFKDGKYLMVGQNAQGQSGKCQANYETAGDIIRLTYFSDTDECVGEIDDIQWRIDGDGLHLHLVAIKNAGLIEMKALFEAKPWQKVADQ